MAQNWFKHDYNAKSDDKILELRACHGWKGYGLFYALIERMAGNEIGAIDLERIGGLSIDLNIKKDELQTFIDDCLEIGIFIKDDNGWIRNKRITNHVEMMESYREYGRKGAKIRHSKKSDKGANSPPNREATAEGNSPPNADKSRGDNTRTKVQNREQKSPKIKEGEDFSHVPLVNGQENGNV